MKYLLFAAGALVLLAFVLMLVPGFQFSIVLCFGFSALLILLYFLLKHPTAATIVLRKLTLLLLLIGSLSAAVTAAFIIRAAHPDRQPSCDYIIVLGAGVRGSVPSLALQERTQAAYDYLVANPQSIAVLTGGQGPGEDMTEAACMYRELTAMGIDGSRLLMEEKATSTMENLIYSLEILSAEKGIRPECVGIVSSEYHLFRAGLLAKKLGLTSFGIPGKTAWVSLRVNYYLREVAAVWKCLVFGS